MPQAETDIATGQRVIRLEAAGLAALAESLGASFAAAVERLALAGGRVVVSGMGKSGHVGRKIAATLASTGTPAMFVHPAEAGHGDLGMIVPGDAILGLSNSGDTPELAAIIAHAHRFAIPLVAITGRADSMLGRAAAIVLELPAVPEACPIGLAPTTSTTLQLALGDALAVALLERRGFTPQDFRIFHPGGRLGAQLTFVRDMMHGADELPLGTPQMRMDEALLAMTARRFGALGIVEEGRLAGIITDGDLRRALRAGADRLMEASAGEVMTRNPRSIGPDMLAGEALRVMNENKITILFVTDGQGAPVGILHVHDLLRAGVA